ncbi:nicotinamide mononucleotide transporter [Mycoplasmopsis lipophila]|uniref:nicotinamide mononucleotide transporter n=1 Tax=Mycoplasmopsis lipophila TaxID=2117 RepID=UPI00387302BB
MKNKRKTIKIIKLFSLIISFGIATFLSLFSFEKMQWIWDEGFLYQKILGSFAGFSAFAGILSTIYFWKRNQKGYWLGIIHALLFGMYALSVNLTGEFIVNLIFYIPIYIYLWIKLNVGNKIKILVINIRSLIIFINLGIIIFISFWFITPLLNDIWAKFLKLDSVKYGNNFNYFIFAKVLSNLINTICIIALIMMIFGYQQSWYVWLVKNALAIIFFSGIGFLNVSVIIMNILYGSLSIFIYINVKKEKHLHISIIGPGAVGKSTIIEKLKIFFKEKDIKIFDERDFLEGKFEEYMKNMPDNAYDMQKLFFSERLKQIDQSFLEKRTVMDRHLIDDFIFPRVHMELNNFNEYQKNQWFKVEKQYINKLSRRPKLDPWKSGLLE